MRQEAEAEYKHQPSVPDLSRRTSTRRVSIGGNKDREDHNKKNNNNIDKSRRISVQASRNIKVFILFIYIFI